MIGKRLKILAVRSHDGMLYLLAAITTKRSNNTNTITTTMIIPIIICLYIL